jgi:hypothetical protein
MTRGVHGDEPAEVEAGLSFLEGPVEAYLDAYYFSVIPCVNTSGLELGIWANNAGQDINRAMSDDSVTESVLLQRFTKGRRYEVFFDHHEGYEETGFFMYEAECENRLVGARIVEAIKEVAPIDGDDNTDQRLDTPISEGLFGINPKRGKQGWSAYAYYQNSNYVVFCETTSTARPLEQRVRAHPVAQKMTLDHYLN